MDDPKTRRESKGKGGKKDKGHVYSAKHVRLAAAVASAAVKPVAKKK
jgi:hypothetical protein